MKLNQFQRLMLRWNNLHPYNAVHVVRIPSPLDCERLKQAISTTLQSLGLGEIFPTRMTGNLGSTRYAMRDTLALEIPLLPPNDPAILHSEIQRQLNVPFLGGIRVDPFRFFAQTDGSSFFLGLTYFHPIADAESIVWLVKMCVEA